MNILLHIRAGPVLCRDEQGRPCQHYTPGGYCRIFGLLLKNDNNELTRAPECLEAERAAPQEGANT